MGQGMDSIANPHQNDDPGAIIAFPDETFGSRKKSLPKAAELRRVLLMLDQ
jgi:hypothetical protein